MIETKHETINTKKQHENQQEETINNLNESTKQYIRNNHIKLTRNTKQYQTNTKQ